MEDEEVLGKLVYSYPRKTGKVQPYVVALAMVVRRVQKGFPMDEQQSGSQVVAVVTSSQMVVWKGSLQPHCD